MIRRRFVLLLILLLAFALRIAVIGFNSYHPDEKTVLGMAQKMVTSGSLEPTKMNYGTLTVYAQALLIFLARLVRGWAGRPSASVPGQELVLARLVSVFSSVATVALTAALARAALRPPRRIDAADPTFRTIEPAPRPAVRMAAWLAPLIMAVSFLSVQCAHYTTVDSLMTLLASATVLMALKAYEDGRRRYFVTAGVLAGLATATKYTAVLAALPLVLVPVLTTRRPRPWRNTAIGLFAILPTFLLGMPYAVLQPAKFLGALNFESKHYRQGGETIFAMGPDTGWWNVEFLYYTALGPALFLMALFGIVWLLSGKRQEMLELPDRRKAVIFLAYPVAVFAFISSFTVRFDRNLLPLIPFLSVCAAAYGAYAWERLARRSRTLAAVLIVPTIALAITYPLMRDIVFDLQIRKPHPKRMVQEWKATLPYGKRNVRHHERAQGDPVHKLQERGFDYVVMSSHSYEPVAAHPDRYPLLYRNYREIFDRCRQVQIFENPWFASDFFTPHHLLNSATVNVYHGPTLRVLEVPKLETGSTAAGSNAQERKSAPDRPMGARGAASHKEEAEGDEAPPDGD